MLNHATLNTSWLKYVTITDPGSPPAEDGWLLLAGMIGWLERTSWDVLGLSSSCLEAQRLCRRGPNFFRHGLGDVLGLSWTCLELFGACLGPVLGCLRACLVPVVGLPWACLGLSWSISHKVTQKSSLGISLSSTDRQLTLFGACGNTCCAPCWGPHNSKMCRYGLQRCAKRAQTAKAYVFEDAFRFVLIVFL
jgi:hypothetical protein